MCQNPLPLHSFIHSSFFWGLFGGTRISTQGFELALPLESLPYPFLLWLVLRQTHVYAQASQGYNPPMYTTSVAGITGVHNHAQLLLVEMGFRELFALADLEPQSSQ
jgi:hypothetical protein